MRITRYVNGKRKDNLFENKTVIDNEIVFSTIERVNRRLNNGFKADGEKTK